MRKKLKIPYKYRKKTWYTDLNNHRIEDEGKLCERPFQVFRTPINFFYVDTPFSLYETQAEYVDAGYEEHCHAKISNISKHIPLGDIGKISVKEMMRSGSGSDDCSSTVFCDDDACVSGYEGRAVSLRGNAAVSGDRSVAVSLGDHESAAAAGSGSHAIAVTHGGNAAASGFDGHAVTLNDGWAISNRGVAAALDTLGKAVSCGTQGMAVACKKAYAFGKEGHAVACTVCGQFKELSEAWQIVENWLNATR